MSIGQTYLVVYWCVIQIYFDSVYKGLMIHEINRCRSKLINIWSENTNINAFQAKTFSIEILKAAKPITWRDISLRVFNEKFVVLFEKKTEPIVVIHTWSNWILSRILKYFQDLLISVVTKHFMHAWMFCRNRVIGWLMLFIMYFNYLNVFTPTATHTIGKQK